MIGYFFPSLCRIKLDLIKREPFRYTYKGPMAFLVTKADEACVRGGRYLPIEITVL